MNRIIKYVFYDILRTRFVAFYSLFLMISTIGLFQFDSDTAKVILSLLNIVLMVVPLISIVFTTIYFFNSYEFTELLLAQPINRSSIFFSQYISVASSLCLAFVIGVGVPVFIFGSGTIGITLLLTGVLLTTVFVSLAFLSSVITRDKAKAIGLALLFWFYFSLIYDGLLLWIIYAFSEYPMEKATLALVALNPIDLARIMMILQMDISALMGYTGAFYKHFFGSGLGTLFSIGILTLWTTLPLWMAARIFKKKDL